MKNPTLKKIIEERNKNHPEEKELNSFLVNDKWKVVDPVNNNKSKIFDLDPIFSDLSIEYAITAKLILLIQIKTYQNKILSKASTFNNLLGKISHCTRALRSMNLSSLKDINENNATTFYNHIVTKSKGELYALSTIRTVVIKLLTESSRANNKYPDGPTIQITWDRFLDCVKPTVTKVMSWPEWLAGGTLGSFPIEYALVILNESIKVIADEESVRIAKSHLIGLKNAQQEHNTIKHKDLNQILIGLSNKTCGYDAQGFYIVNISKNPSKPRIYESDALAKQGRKSFVIAKSIFGEYIRLKGRKKSFSSFLNKIELNKLIRNIMHACAANIQILSGIRKSELNSLKRSAFSNEISGDISFVSSIKKTNHSIETTRLISQVAWQAIETAKNLHVPASKLKESDISNCLLRINVSYKTKIICGDSWEFCGANKKLGGLTVWMKKVLGKRVKDIDFDSIPNPTSHRFRHTWVEIALRRFDGNVPEAIRHYFRHAYGSKNTVAYIRGKIKQELPQLERHYIRELIGRAASGKEDFYGPIGTYLLQRVKELDVLTDEDIEELANEFDVLEPHEYGYCMIRKDQKTQAKCYDKNTNSPNYNAARFQHCGACAGNLRMANHRDSILRIGMREQEVIESRRSQGLSFLADQSQKILKLCESAINQMDKKIPANIIDEAK